MKKFFLVIILVMFISECLAYDLTNYKKINFSFFSKFQTTSNKIVIQSELFPYEDDIQSIESINFFVLPSGEFNKENEKLIYTSYNQEGIFGWNSILITKTYFPEIRKIIYFPVRYNQTFFNYTRPSKYIDSDNPLIVTKANEIAQGKTDFYDILNSINTYVYENIEYNSSYVGELKKASEILYEKKGVCSHYAILFAGLSRALGIPTRVVSGRAYSDRTKNFEGHGWVEVYDGNVWVPFDPTFGQNGWLDSSHIGLAKSVDYESLITFRYDSDGELNTSGLNFSEYVLKEGDKFKKDIDLKINLLEDRVSFDSYTPIEVKITNPYDYYLPLVIYLVKTPEVLNNKTVKFAILKPKETKSVYYIVKTPRGSRDYIYSAVIGVKTNVGKYVETSLTFFSEGKKIELEEAQKIVKKLERTNWNESYNFDINCYLGPMYRGDYVEINCTLKSFSNIMIENATICFESYCKNKTLPINTEISVTFNISVSGNIGLIEITKNNSIISRKYIGMNVLEKPEPKVIDVRPKEIQYSQEIINLIIDSKSHCYNTSIFLNGKKLFLNKISNETIQVNFAGKYALKEKLDVELFCYDLLGREYHDFESFNVKITNLTFFGKIKKFFIKIL